MEAGLNGVLTHRAQRAVEVERISGREAVPIRVRQMVGKIAPATPEKTTPVILQRVQLRPHPRPQRHPRPRLYQQPFLRVRISQTFVTTAVSIHCTDVIKYFELSRVRRI